jgi:hypothetical protein
MKKSLLLFAFVLVFSQISFAQTHLGFGALVGIPTNEFKDNTRAVGAGFNLHAMFPVAQNVPIYAGFNFGYMLYGSNTQQINELLKVYAGNTIISQIPVNLRVTTNNNMYLGQFVFRLKAPLSNVQPYADGILGFNYINTRTKIYDETTNRIFINDPDQTDNVINARTQVQSWVLNYGVGGGLMFKLGANIALDLRAIYVLGGEAEYYDRSQTENWKVDFTGPSGTFDPNNPENIGLDNSSIAKRSRTDMAQITLGLVFNL